MSRLLDIENRILNAQSGGQTLSFALEHCATEHSVLSCSVCIFPKWKAIKQKQEEEEKKRRMAEAEAEAARRRAEAEKARRKAEAEEARKKAEAEAEAERRKAERLRQEREEKRRRLEEDRQRRGTANAVDLGLSVLWASHNIGGRSPEQTGIYASWNQKKEALEVWGEDWRMPSTQEMMELMQQCQWMWSAQNGMPGFLVTGRNGNQIFLPACGSCVAMQYDSYGAAGRYWCNNPDGKYGDRAMYLEFNQMSGNLFSISKTMQMSFRPVKNK